MSASPSGNLGDIVRRVTPDGGWLDLADRRRMSAAEIDDAASRLSAALISLGLARGDRVAILAANGLQYVITYLGLMRAGLVPVLLNYRLPADAITHILRDCEPKLTLVDELRAASLPAGFRLQHLGELDALTAQDIVPPVRPERGEIAQILYTSGSSGRPKGVPLSHDGQLWALDRFLAVSSRAPGRTIIAAPMYHMNGLFVTTVALALGYFTVSMPSFDARSYLEHVAQHNCTFISGIPTMFAMMARQEDLIASLDLSSVKEVVVGSAPLSQALVGRIRAIFTKADVRNSYGTTETGPAMFGPHPAGLTRPPLALGYPYPGMEWRLRDGKSPDEGALETRTPATMHEYLNLPEATAERLVDGWYQTGDILRKDATGFFHFVGRADDMFVCGGENIYPGDIEQLLEQHPDVLQAAVLPAEDEVKGAIPIAFVVPLPGRKIVEADIKSFALERGPAFAHPRAVVMLDSMPSGGTHKIDRALLAQEATKIARRLQR